MKLENTIHYARIPTNTARSCWTLLTMTDEKQLAEQLEYDKKYRWGQSLFVNNKCVHISELSGHTPEKVADLEQKLSKLF